MRAGAAAGSTARPRREPLPAGSRDGPCGQRCGQGPGCIPIHSGASTGRHRWCLPSGGSPVPLPPQAAAGRGVGCAHEAAGLLVLSVSSPRTVLGGAGGCSCSRESGVRMGSVPNLCRACPHSARSTARDMAGGRLCVPTLGWHQLRYRSPGAKTQGGALGTWHRELYGKIRHQAFNRHQCSYRPPPPPRTATKGKGTEQGPAASVTPRALVTPRYPPGLVGHGVGAACQRGSQSMAPGIGWRRSPWGMAAATRCPGEPPQPAGQGAELVQCLWWGGSRWCRERSQCGERVCWAGHCWGEAHSTRNPTGFSRDWKSQQQTQAVHGEQMGRGGDTRYRDVSILAP